MLAEEKPRRVVHPVNVERARFVMRVTRPEGRNDGRVDNAVKIGFALRRKTRVKIVRRFFDIQNPQIAPQIAVYRGTQLLGRERLFKLDIGDLTFGMSARVGSARTAYVNVFAFEQ